MDHECSSGQRSQQGRQATRHRIESGGSTIGTQRTRQRGQDRSGRCARTARHHGAGVCRTQCHEPRCRAKALDDKLATSIQARTNAEGAKAVTAHEALEKEQKAQLDTAVNEAARLNLEAQQEQQAQIDTVAKDIKDKKAEIKEEKRQLSADFKAEIKKAAGDKRQALDTELANAESKIENEFKSAEAEPIKRRKLPRPLRKKRKKQDQGFLVQLGERCGSSGD